MPDTGTSSSADWLKRERLPIRRSLLQVVALGLAGGLLLIGQAGLLASLADAVILHSATLAGLWPLLWGLLAVFLLRAVLIWAAERTAFAAAARVKLDLRRRLFAQLQRLGPARLAGASSGELSSALLDNVEALEGYYARFLPQMALAALLPLTILVFVLPADWFSGLVLVLTAPLIPIFMALIGKGAETLNQRQWRRLAILSARLLDGIQGLTTLKLFNASRREAQVIARLSEDYRHSTMAVLRVAFLSSLTLEFFASVSIAVVAVFIGFRLLGALGWGPIDFRVGFFVLLLAPEFFQPLRNLATQYHARMEAIGAAERLVEILEQPFAEPVASPRPVPPGERFHIAFERVSFAYEPGRAALEELSLEVQPGQRVALVGPSGAGKSTVVSLLLGFLVPDGGVIRINGEPLSEIDLAAWRSQLAWVPQRPRIFHGSLRENILLGRPDADEAALRRAARLARADEFIERLDQGYDTQVGERGQGLSGGQAQRIALARAFLRDAPLVLLDEATASLDAESEDLVQAGIDELARGRTLVVIAHRLSTVRDADQILVLDHGRLVEQGDHHTLLARQGLYAGLVHAYGVAA